MAKKMKSSIPKPKKKAKSYVTGKTKSVVGSIYTYKKQKKPKRYGYTCMYYVKDKLTCQLTKALCKNADSCSSYRSNSQGTQTQKSQHKPPVVRQPHKIDEVGITAIVLNDNRLCTNSSHLIIDVDAKLRIAPREGSIIIHTVPAAYCEECDTYFVLKKDYKEAKGYGTILCPIIDMTAQSLQKKGSSALSTSESRIHQLGYNVKRGNGYTKEQRQLILANILENTNISKYEIESCILRPMMQHKNQANYSEAVSAWKEDLEFVKGYKHGDIPEVIIERIIIGKRPNK